MDGRVLYLRAIRQLLGSVGRVVEVGVLRGRYAASLLRELAPRELILVDPWAPHAGTYAKDTADVWEARYNHVRLKFAGEKAVRIWRSTSLTAAGCVENSSCDLVYLDAQHTEDAVVADLAAWEPKVRPGGFLAGHDFGDYDKDHRVLSACRRFFGSDFRKLVTPPERTKPIFPPSFFYRMP